MFLVRTKILTILMSCAIVILFFSKYYNNGNLRVKSCENCRKKSQGFLNIYKTASKALRFNNSQHEYSYGKNVFSYDARDVSVTTEIEDELQNYNALNKIEYIDFMNNSEHINITHTDPNIISLKQLLSVCVKAAKAGGIQLQSVRRNFDLREIWKIKPADSFDNPVSVGKSLSHQAMAYTLRKYFPNIQLVSRKDNGYTIDRFDKDFQPRHKSDDTLVPIKNVLVWFDSLDPEHEYNNNYLEYVTTTVCVAVKGKPVIGVIHQPFENFTKWGWVGHGVSGDSYPVASEPVDVSKPLQIVLPTAHAATVRIKVRMVFGVHFNLFAVNGAGYGILQVSEGRADGYLHTFDIKKWKICAGDAIIRASGGKVTTINNKKIDYGDPALYINEKGLKASIVDPKMFDDFDSREGGRKRIKPHKKVSLSKPDYS